MIAFDTNILVRILAKDDLAQLKKIREWLRKNSNTIFICDTVILECVWVLQSVYKWSRKEIATSLLSAMSKTDVFLEDENTFFEAMSKYELGGDIGDHWIASKAKKQKCKNVLSFDQLFQKQNPAFVSSPS